jgi:hypothetical protein
LPPTCTPPSDVLTYPFAIASWEDGATHCYTLSDPSTDVECFSQYWEANAYKYISFCQGLCPYWYNQEMSGAGRARNTP